ncbi:hypothetical protein [Phycicoccus avicenniae]|uniref:hypothetical protein n=1 Tax=Phycicoccus avicenniae TaxID=2828860 RepID=UPI003D2D3A85
MALSFDEPSDTSEKECDRCGAGYTLVKSLIRDADGPHAVAFSALHHHDGQHEAWIDAILGSFDDDCSDHVTFGCRVGPVDGSAEPAATAVEAAVPYGDSPLWGRRLRREEALAHDRLDDYWQVVDFLLEHEPTVRAHVHHRG